jgi:hypothetical protein
MLAPFDGYERIYTDASKDGPALAAAAMWRLGTLVRGLCNDASIFSGEAHAILLALNMAEQARDAGADPQPCFKWWAPMKMYPLVPHHILVFYYAVNHFRSLIPFLLLIESESFKKSGLTSYHC